MLHIRISYVTTHQRVTSHIPMSHGVSHIRMSHGVTHIWMSHITRIRMSHVAMIRQPKPKDLLPRQGRVMSHVRIKSHISMSHVTHQWVTSHISMSHVTHLDESRHTYQWVTSHINESLHISMSHFTHINESRHTYQWVMSHISTRYATHHNTYDNIILRRRKRGEENMTDSHAVWRSCRKWFEPFSVIHMHGSCHTYE